MGMTHTPLLLQFADQAVSITIPAHGDDCLPKQLRRHFAGCLAENGEVTAVFRLETPQSKMWQLWQDDTLLLETEAFTDLFEPLMQAILVQLITPAADHLILHAGGVALTEWGVLLCGASGSGKSTLTAQLLKEGFRYLSDEALAVDLNLKVMHGFARSLVLKAGSDFIWHGQQASDDVLLLANGITWVTPAFLDGITIPRASPQLLLFPQFEQGSTLTVVPLSAGETAFALLQNLANARNLPDKGFHLAAELARNMPAYRVVYGNETAVANWIYTQLPQR
jgi:hypothetical protein